MKYYRVLTPTGPSWAREEGECLRLLSAAPWTEDVTDLNEKLEADEARLLAPAAPSKIVAVGLNYRDHAQERGKPIPDEPLLFLKPPSSVIGPGDAIRRPAWAGRVDHEAELGLVIGRKAHDLPSPGSAAAHIFGVTCVNDVTARELQDRDVQFTRAKGFDTFCPIGPCLAAGLDLGALAVEGRVNGQVRQRSTTAQLIFPPRTWSGPFRA